MEIKEIILSSVALNYTRAIWAHPIDGDIVELRVFNNGEWQATTVKTDLSNYVTIPSLERELANYLTITAATDSYQPIGDYASSNDLQSHVNNTENPHSVTKEQVGLGNVDNTSDIDKPISTAVQNALNNKQNSTDNNLSTTDKTIVGAINEILPKATGVGKVYPNSDGNGEIFNSYKGSTANVASGGYSHVEGIKNTASGYASHAEGTDNIASGNYSHVECQSNNASGFYSHSEGRYTTASGQASHAEGTHTEALTLAEHAEGYYNKSYDNEDSSIRVIHSVGIGSSDDDRKNAHEIKFNGDHYVYGLGSFDGTNSADAQTLQEVVNSKQATITAGTGIEITPENQINVTLDTNVFFVAETVPESPSDDQKKKICLVPADTTEEGNFYTEYVWVIDDTHPNGYWEEFGTYKSEVDLTPYLKTADAANTYLSKTDAASTYLSKTDASSTYLNKTDAASTYVPKDGTGATGSWEIDITGSAVYLSPTSIPENADLNDYTTSGMYYCGSNSVVYTMSNCPTIKAFSLLVEHHAGTKQTLTEYLSDNPKMWFRNCYNDTWGPWYQINYGPQNGNIITVPTLTQAYTIPENSSDMELTYIITIGATAYSITGASGIKWAGGILPQVSPNTTIVVSVLNNLATWQTFV